LKLLQLHSWIENQSAR